MGSYNDFVDVVQDGVQHVLQLERGGAHFLKVGDHARLTQLRELGALHEIDCKQNTTVEM